ncbi:MAG: ubiquitin-conjugating enzyme E2 [Candidatus Hermodarchaeota archaeon]
MPELPFEIWKDRINNEIKNLEHLNVIERNSIVWHDNNVEFLINIRAIGFILGDYQKDVNLIPQKSHRIFLKINRSFPYPGGLDFSWYSNIFHPNIHPVELIYSKVRGTGYICLNVLKQWSRLSDLETTVKALQKLVENPNPEDPLKYDICLEAAEFFKKTSIEDLKKQYNIEEIEEEQDKDEIIILDD